MNDQSQITNFAQMISNVGFPIVVAVILLRSVLNNFHSRLDELNQTMQELLVAIRGLNSKDKEGKG